jgi:hypothetical protein
VNEKQEILTALREEFIRWQELLASLSEGQITDPLVPSSWSVRDVLLHLWGWQQASVARAEAAVQDKEPDYPRWWEIFGPDPEEDVDRTNAWFYDTYRDKPWPAVYTDWKEQFARYLELAEAIPEKDLLEPGRYAWMEGYTLIASLQGSCEHHEEHREMLLAWLREHGWKEGIREVRGT